MDQARHPTRGVAAGRAALVVFRSALRATSRAALVALLRAALHLLFVPREPPVSGLSDRQLADIGLTREDVGRSPERTSSAGFDVRHVL